MHVWRLQRSVHPVLDGEGARRFGGRWNRPGRAVVYTSDNLAICVLEMLVHLDSDLVPSDYFAYELEVPDQLSSGRIDIGDLPARWSRNAACAECIRIGEAWLDAKSTPVLEVPSALVPRGRNFLINPQHPEAANIRITGEEPFRLDPRLMK